MLKTEEDERMAATTTDAAKRIELKTKDQRITPPS
jgi:hypothetical protein